MIDLKLTLAVVIALVAAAFLIRSEEDSSMDTTTSKAANAAAANYLDLLGYTVTDKVTGFKGVVESISWDLYGCIQAVVRPPVDDKGNLPDGKWLDVLRLEINRDHARVMEIPGGFQNYGPGPSTTLDPHGPADKPAR